MTRTPKLEKPPRRRRKEDRPGEIVAAAIDVFVERGYGAAKIEEIARRAGVAKGTVFTYFATKEDLFRAAAKTVLSTAFEGQSKVETGGLDLPLDELVPRLLDQAISLDDDRTSALMRILITASRTFPQLAEVWYDEVVSNMQGIAELTIKGAQDRGEMRPGNPRMIAFSIVGPLLAGMIVREIFRGTSEPTPDLKALAKQHGEIILNGLKLAPTDKNIQTVKPKTKARIANV